MWKPPERIRHTLPEGGWPSAQEAARSRWFSPIAYRSFALQQRTWVPAMVPWRATDDGCVTPDVLDWYRRFAQGRPGGLVVEATGIRDVPSGPLLRIGHDRFVPGLRALVDVVREASDGQTRLFIQIIDFLRVHRRPTADVYFSRYLRVGDHHRAAFPGHTDAEILHALSEAPAERLEHLLSPRELEALRFGHRESVNDLALEHIRGLPSVLPDLFADAAERARYAGFDGVELHYAHAYTMASFLSRTNLRNDGYGGDIAGRLRLPLEVLARVRTRVGSDYCVGARMLSEEIIAEGSTLDETMIFARHLAAAGLDFISLSRGGRFEDALQPKPGWAAYPYTGRSGYECMPTVQSDADGPFGRNVTCAASIRTAIRDAGLATPVVVAGGICSYTQAEAILAAGQADVVGAARQTLADPDWFRKVRLGRGDEVRRCRFTNYCEALDQQHKQVTCQLWDRLELDDANARRSHDGRRRLIAPSWKDQRDANDGEQVS